QEELGDLGDASERVAGGRERRVVVAVEENHWIVLEMTVLGASEADHGHGEVMIDGHRKALWKRGGKRGALLGRRLGTGDRGRQDHPYSENHELTSQRLHVYAPCLKDV